MGVKPGVLLCWAYMGTAVGEWLCGLAIRMASIAATSTHPDQHDSQVWRGEVEVVKLGLCEHREAVALAGAASRGGASGAKSG